MIFKTLRAQRHRFVAVYVAFIALALVLAAADVFMTLTAGDMAQATYDMDESLLLRLIAIITGLMLTRAIASAASALLLGRFAGGAGYRFRDNFARFFLARPFSAFEKSPTGETLSVFTNDVPLSVALAASEGIRMIGDIFTLVAVLGAMFWLNWLLTLIFFASFPVCWFFKFWHPCPSRRPANAAWKRSRHIMQS
jgi:subfamily B ATP-binding cassette protein MsbA